MESNSRSQRASKAMSGSPLATSSLTASMAAHSTASRILSVNYLESHTSKKDLVTRLRKMISVVQTDATIDIDSPEFSSGLSSLTQGLVPLVNHRDKQVRLYVVLLCMELFSVFAPNAPWDAKQTIDIFRQTIRQLANLSHTTQPNQSNYSQYVRILELLADVKIGIVLVELAKQAEDQSNGYAMNTSQDSLQFDEDVSDGREALVVLKELFRTVLQSIRLDHPSQVAELSQRALLACLEEYYEGILVPLQLLDELLVCIGQGRTVLVTNPALGSALAKQQQEQQQSKRGRTKNKSSTPSMPPLQVEQVNPAYLVAASVVRKGVYRLSTPIASLLNGLLNGDPRTVQESDLLVHTTEEQTNAANPTSSSDNDASPLLVLDTPQRQQQTPSASVWAVIFELHKIAPTILTTVIGTVANHLTSPDQTKRSLVAQLLGRLFAAKHSTMALEFRPCFREWMKRLNDVVPQIRRYMTDILLELLVVGANRKERQEDWKEVGMQVQLALGCLLDNDADSQVRLHILHRICDTAYAHREVISRDLLGKVAAYVTSKHKQERRDVMTGLAQTYFKQYLSQILRTIQMGGDDVDLQIIVRVLHSVCHTNRTSQSGHVPTAPISGDDLHDRYQWIPQIVFQCASYTDATDTEMRNRVVQVVDDLLLGSDLPSSSKKLTPTARAVGLAVVVDSLQRHDINPLTRSSPGGPSKSYHWMCNLLEQRAKLQRAVGRYLDARGDVRLHTPGSEEAMTANAKAEDLLEAVAALTAPPTTTSSNSQPLAPGERIPVLQKFHALKDKRIFRILSTIVTPTHSTSARVRALEELPKRIKQQLNHRKNSKSKLSDEDGLLSWVKGLTRRCAMGDFINAEVIHHCILLAQECFHEEDALSCRAFVGGIKVAVRYFPELCVATDETFSTLVKLFTDARGLEKGSKFQMEVEECKLISDLSAVLAAGAPANNAAESSALAGQGLSSHLVKVCCGDGSPEEARLAVNTMAALINPKQDSESTQNKNGSFELLLNALTMPSRLTMAKKSQSMKLVSVLVSLAELAECAPHVFRGSSRGKKSIQFAFEMVMLGRGHSTNSGKDPETDSDSDEDFVSDGNRRLKSASTPASRINAATLTNVSPNGNVSLLEDDTLSISCRTLCAAMAFLASYIRSSLLAAEVKQSSDTEDDRLGSQGSNQNAGPRKGPPVEVDSGPQADLIENVFSILCQILRDQGLPPSSHDRTQCKLRHHRAALRQCAAIHLLRLCDARLNLDKFLTTARWHTLSGAFLDDERVVREKVMEELGLLLTGNGKYRKDGTAKAMAPRLRMLALVTLCVDGDHGADHTAANGMAANVGKLSVNTKMNATQCVSTLRKTYEVTSAQSRALGSRAEKQFENSMKVMLMPECVVPWAFHLLSFRRETPSAGGAAYSKSTGLTQTSHDDEEYYEVDEGQQRTLRKRLKWLFDPLVLSLGESADNISFLMRMTEVMAKSFLPVGFWSDFEGKGRESSPPSFRLSLGSDEGDEDLTLKAELMEEKMALASAKLKIICAAAREVLLSYVKKDVNLTAYPGQIQLPRHLFQRILSTTSARRSSSSKAILPLNRRENRKLGTVDGQGRKRSSGESFEDIQQRTPKRRQNTPESLGSDKSGKSSSFSNNRDLRTRKSINSTKQSARKSRVSLSLDSAEGSIARKTRSSQEHQIRGDSPNRELLDISPGSSEENNGPGSWSRAAKRRGRASHGLTSSSQEKDLSATGLRPSMEVDDLSPMEGSRSSRVHFSPELSIRSIRKDSRKSTGNFDDDLSPIRMEGSPSMENRTSRGHLPGSDEKTCGSTPPSILRGATMSGTASPGAVCATHDSPLSQASKSEKGAGASEDTVDQIQHSNVTDDGDRAKRTSKARSSGEEQNRSDCSRKSISSKKLTSPVGGRQQPKKKLKASIPTQIKVNRNKRPSQVKRGTSRVLRPTNRVGALVTNNADSLDFDDDVIGPPSSKKMTPGSARNKSKKNVDKVASSGKRNTRVPNKTTPIVNKQRKRRAQKN